MRVNWRKALARKRSSNNEPVDTSIGSPDWNYMYGRRSYPLEDYHPPRKEHHRHRRKTAEEREQEEQDEADLRHEQFVEDMKKQGRWDVIDDPEIAVIAYDKWERKEYPELYAKKRW